MFFSQFILSKKGPLAKIWLAAHWEKKLSKAQITETNVQDAVDEIIKPKVKLSLRTTGHLLLGLVRIYSRKAKYVLADCNEAFLKLKMAFKPGSAIDKELRDREERDIPEVVTDFYDNIPEINDYDLGISGNFNVNQGRIEDITLRDDIRFETSSNHGLAFGPGEDGLDDFGEREHLKHDAPRASSQGLFDEHFHSEQARESRNNIDPRPSVLKNTSQSLLDESSKNQNANLDGLEIADFGTAEELDLIFNGNDLGAQVTMDMNAPGAEFEEPIMDIEMEDQENRTIESQDSFRLEPLDNEALQREKPQQGRQKRKRKLIIDEQKNITGDEMKANMNDYFDICNHLDLAPPNKTMMYIKEYGTLDKIFTLPGCVDWLDSEIIQLYQSHLIPYARDPADKLAQEIQIRREMELEETIHDFQMQEPRVLDAMLQNNAAEMDYPNVPDENVEPAPFASIVNDQNATADYEFHISGIIEKRSATRKSRSDEVAEGEEDEVFTRRTKNVLTSIAAKLRTNNDKITFDDLLTKGSTRRTAAQKFYAILELKKWQAIEVDQEGGFGTISISAGTRMQDTLKLAV